jgi:hypothetical protein
MTDRGEDDVLITISPSPFRRWSAILVFVALGFVLLWLAFMGKGEIGWRLFFVAFGVAAFWMSDLMRRSTMQEIELTRGEIRTTDGRVLTTVSNVSKVERGAFAFKPSNGFLVRLKVPSGRGWAPGLWWQSGTYLGVGGVVSAGQSKAMAEILAAILAGVWSESPST